MLFYTLLIESSKVAVAINFNCRSHFAQLPHLYWVYHWAGTRECLKVDLTSHCQALQQDIANKYIGVKVIILENRRKTLDCCISFVVFPSTKYAFMLWLKICFHSHATFMLCKWFILYYIIKKSYILIFMSVYATFGEMAPIHCRIHTT